MTRTEWVASLKRAYLRRLVKYGGRVYRVVEVDCDGWLLIDKETNFAETSAVTPSMVQLVQ